VSIPWLDDTGGPTIVVYDGYQGGAGVAELGYEAGDHHLAAPLEVLAGCSCHEGCPSCVQSPKCGNLNEPLDKAGAIALLRTVLASGQPVPSSSSSASQRS
jgi:DEAD/DEAH box helicase domain-containing protein